MTESPFAAQFENIREAVTDYDQAITIAQNLEAQAKQLRANGKKSWQSQINVTSLAIVEAARAEQISPAEAVGAYLDLEKVFKLGPATPSSYQLLFRQMHERNSRIAPITKLGIMAVIATMDTDVPILGYSPLDTVSGILSGPATLKFSTSAPGTDDRRNSYLEPGFDVQMQLKQIKKDGSLSLPTTEILNFKRLEGRYTVGQTAIQAVFDETKFEESYETDSCGAHHSSHRVTNASRLKHYLNLAKAFNTAGISFDTTNLENSQGTSAVSDLNAYIRQSERRSQQPPFRYR